MAFTVPLLALSLMLFAAAGWLCGCSYFTIPNEDDITSGGCTTCEVGGIVSNDPSLGPGWSRPHFGDCFTFHPEWPEHNLHSTTWYRCGVSIP